MPVPDEFKLGNVIEFANDLPYTIQAIGHRFAVLTRPVVASDTDDFAESLRRNAVIYTILDSVTWQRGPHDLVLNPFDLSTADGCRQCLAALESGECALSRRNSIPARFVEE